MAEKFLKQYEILLVKAKEDLVAAKYLLDGFYHHDLNLHLEIILLSLAAVCGKANKSTFGF